MSAECHDFRVKRTYITIPLGDVFQLHPELDGHCSPEVCKNTFKEGVNTNSDAPRSTPTEVCSLHFTLTFRHSDAFIKSDLQYIFQKKETTIYRCRYSKDVHRSKWQTLIITRLTHSPYTTKIAMIRRYTNAKYYFYV